VEFRVENLQEFWLSVQAPKTASGPSLGHSVHAGTIRPGASAVPIQRVFEA
jgi:hypothetical protein